ncbi:Tartrate dehydrogenase [Lentibacillus sp. JNUCC-1]|uniref:tartrate dehydrogenase n=1 Tax=Lentibacillus sp. JNUCC-1 TaxID=2654513 RepID=UPI0012E95396|nr:tartrate dehydrogenase [Lentibacillus sp. JNUCC-1]MUV37149.1 Tartrate dehydrogenase [Lentibacillus sp. JNUCC-1]
MKKYSLGVISGDGIGPEIMEQALKVLNVVEKIHGGIHFKENRYDWGCEYYLKNHKMMPDDGLDRLRENDAILFGAVGAPSVPDDISVWELILPIRQQFEQYVNLRPIKQLQGIESPLKKLNGNIDFTIIRENTEGEYSKIGGKLHANTPNEVVIQNNVFTRFGTERIFDYGFNYAQQKQKKSVTVATKSNAIKHSMTFWDEIGKKFESKHNLQVDYYHIDALAAYFITRPEDFEVIISSNLFGDILSDLGAAVVGGLGLAPSGNINPSGKYPSMFEPIHGSAPDIAGKGIANPIAQIWSVALMLEHLELGNLSELVINAIESTLSNKTIRTPDLGGVNTTEDIGNLIVNNLEKYV